MRHSYELVVKYKSIITTHYFKDIQNAINRETCCARLKICTMTSRSLTRATNDGM